MIAFILSYSESRVKVMIAQPHSLRQPPDHPGRDRDRRTASICRASRAILATGECDFVVGSVPYAEGMQAGWKPVFFEQPLRPAYEAYFRQVIRLAIQGDCDVRRALPDWRDSSEDKYTG
jgi:hypothetical protein